MNQFVMCFYYWTNEVDFNRMRKERLKEVLSTENDKIIIFLKLLFMLYQTIILSNFIFFSIK